MEEESNPIPMSAPARMANILVAPSEVFDDIAKSPVSHATWVLPIILACLASLISVWVTLSDPAVQQQMREMQDQQFDKMVEQGKMTPESRKQAEAAIERFGPGMQKVTMSVGVGFASAAWLFGIALALIVLAKFALRQPLPYMKAVEIVGITGIIAVLESLVRMLLVLIFGNMYATPGPGLFLSSFDAANKFHQVLATLSLISIWYFSVLALGVAKMCNASFTKAGAWIFGLWFGIRWAIICF